MDIAEISKLPMREKFQIMEALLDRRRAKADAGGRGSARLGTGKKHLEREMTRIRIAESARVALEKAFRFDELQEQGLGGCFKSSLNSDIHGIGITAGIHRKTHADCHRVPSRVLPSAICYTYSDGRAETDGQSSIAEETPNGISPLLPDN